MAQERLHGNEFVFWQGTATLRTDGFLDEVTCRVFLDNSTGKELRLEIVHDFGLSAMRFLAEQDMSLELPGIPNTIELILLETNVHSSGESVLLCAVTRSPLWYIKSQELRSGRTVLVNLGIYGIGMSTYSDLNLHALGWAVRLIPVTDKTLMLPQTMSNDRYRHTHQAEFTRDGDSSFTPAEVQELLRNLSLFLSFCRGQWVGTSFTIALGTQGEVSFAQWGSSRVSSWTPPSGWLDEHHPESIEQLYKPFCELLKDKNWFEALSHVVYWFTRAETDAVGPDGAVILLQAALERLAWHVLVRQRQALSEKGFSDLTAADQMRLMLNILSIPSVVPPTLAGLAKLAKSKAFDGPSVFTYIRNKLVHPPKVSATQEKLPFYEAYCLAKWYVELAVLSACKYEGVYSNRTKTSRWVGQVEDVPWA